MKIFRLFLGFIAFGFIACSDFLDEQSQDLTYAASCEDLNEILIGNGYMFHKPIASFAMHKTNCYYPWIHVMDDDLEEFSYTSSFGQFMVRNADNLKSFYCWEKTAFQNQGNTIQDYEWERLYHHISALNVIIKEVDNFPEDPEILRNKVRGEALFLRAAYYWLLANFYAAPYEKDKADKTLGIPLKLTEYIEDKIFHRATLDSVYSQIIEDLQNAGQCLKGIVQPSVYRANQSAVLALLGRVYLYMGEWQKAVDACELVEKKYRPVDLNHFNNKTDFLSSASPETIFIQGVSIMTSMFSRDRGTVSYRISQDLLEIYDKDTDLRYMYFFRKRREGKQFYCTKILDTETKNATGSDVFIIRYPEVLLNKAEALAMLGKEEAAINTLKELLVSRYPFQKVPDITFKGEKLINYIRDERRRELCCEGHRWFDLRRYAVNVKYPYKKTLRHNVYERNTGKKGYGDKIGYYELLPYPEGKGWILPIPDYELEMSGTAMLPNEREDAKFYEL